MLFSWFAGYFAHRRDCALAQQRRAAQLEALQPHYGLPCSEAECSLHELSLRDLVRAHQEGSLTDQDILSAYGKKTLEAHLHTNCIADIVHLPLPDCPVDLHSAGNGYTPDRHSIVYAGRRPLSGVPISIKDCIDVAGHPSTLGYSAFSAPAHPSPTASATIVRLLTAAGALIHVKTTVPTALFGLQTQSALFGPTLHPLVAQAEDADEARKYECWTPAASTGGGGALVALGGSAVEIGTDFGGSIRLPAAFCGLYGLKGTSGRWPAWGMRTSLEGAEGIKTVVGPIARTMDDLQAVCDAVGEMRGWEWDHDCVPIPWTPVNLEGRKLTFGILWFDGIVPPTPACKRALQMTVDALKAAGHTIVDFDFPCKDCLETGFQLGFNDAGDSLLEPLRPQEYLNPGIRSLLAVCRMPHFLKRFISLFLPAADVPLFMKLSRRTIAEERKLTSERDHWRRRWFDGLQAADVDLVLSPVCAVPGLVRDGMGWAGGRGGGKGSEELTGLLGAGYCFLYNILDVPAGVLPVTRVDPDLDALPPSFLASAAFADMAAPAKAMYQSYDEETRSGRMEGLHVGVQVVGGRWDEERVLAGMREVERVLEVERQVKRA